MTPTNVASITADAILVGKRGAELTTCAWFKSAEAFETGKFSDNDYKAIHAEVVRFEGCEDVKLGTFKTYFGYARSVVNMLGRENDKIVYDLAASTVRDMVDQGEVAGWSLQNLPKRVRTALGIADEPKATDEASIDEAPTDEASTADPAVVALQSILAQINSLDAEGVTVARHALDAKADALAAAAAVKVAA